MLRPSTISINKITHSQNQMSRSIDDCMEENATFGMGEWRIKSGMENKSCDVKKRSFFHQKMLRQGFCVTHFSAL